MVSTENLLARSSIFAEVAREEQECAEHGTYTKIIYKNGRETSCPECSKIRMAQQEAEREAKEKEEENSRIIKYTNALIGSSCIPKRFINKNVASYEITCPQQNTVVEAIKKYAYEFKGEHSGRNLALIGNAGSGKTHLACAVALFLIRSLHKTARFTSVSELNRLIREAKSFDSKITESEIIKRIATYDLLIIDEVGIQSGTDAESRAIFDVFNTRYENMKPTIIISNLDIQGLRKALGDRIMDRIKEDGGEILAFNWESYRK